MASKRALRRRSCEGKVRHASAGAAHIAALKTPGTHAYRCNFCGSYHVGHAPARIRQAIAARREAA